MGKQTWLAGVILLVLLPSMFAAGLPDPTRPLSYEEALSSGQSAGKMLLKSVIYAKNRKMVLIGNDFYQVGDKVQSYTITAILPDSAVLENDQGKTIRLSLIADVIKKPSH